ncbi:MAG: hypothetical protein ACRD0P_12060 [Stackebrandtia sp.]
MRTTIPFIIFAVLAIMALTHVWLTFHEPHHRRHHVGHGILHWRWRPFGK